MLFGVFSFTCQFAWSEMQLPVPDFVGIVVALQGDTGRRLQCSQPVHLFIHPFVHIHTYIQMQRLKWHYHSTVAGALYKIIVSNSCSAVFRHRMHETVSSSVPGGTAATMERPWQTTAGHSRHVPLPPGRHGHQVWRVALATRPVSTWQQTGVADMHLRQQTWMV